MNFTAAMRISNCRGLLASILEDASLDRENVQNTFQCYLTEIALGNYEDFLEERMFEKPSEIAF